MNDTHIVIRPARSADAPLLAQYNMAMAHETEAKTLHAPTVAAGVDALFADPGRGFYLVAEVDGTVGGALMVTREWSDWRNGDFWWIQSVYVAPRFRRLGVYRRLYESVRALAAEREHVCGLRLYVEQDNVGAQKSYEALGMRAAGYQVYEELLSRP